MRRTSLTSLWVGWVLANSVAEFIGLGLTLAVGFGVFSRLAQVPGLPGAALTVVPMTALGALEGAIVGAFQWSVLRRGLAGVSRISWIRATIIGAVAAWFLGSLPSAWLGLAAGSSAGFVTQLRPDSVALMAAGMGLVLGLVLGFPQSRVLRKAGEQTWIWIPANMAAWAVGMPVVFASVDAAIDAPGPAVSVVTMAIGLLLTGAAVGAIHGIALVRLSQGRSLALP